VLVVALVAAAAGVVWYRMGVTGSDPTASTPGSVATPDGPGAEPEATSDERTGAARSASSTRGTVVVHVAGAVATPGVLVMPAGARVIDAVEGAGGARPDADLDRLNLAAKLVDGQRILVLAVGAVAPAGDPGVTGGTGAGGLVDLNSATAAQLEALPGIGPALAAAILAERTRRGGFRSVNELREVRGIGEARFADIKDRVTV
jgi:competence protein ComEA